MKIMLRTDASAEIGVGHMIRCMTIAAALKERGAEVSIISREAPVWLSRALKNSGMELICLPDAARPAGGDGRIRRHGARVIDPEADADETISALQGEGSIDWLIVDHYSLGPAWESAVRPHVKAVMAIDDIGRRHDCDILVDQNFCRNFEDRYNGIVPAHCRKLLGPGYAILRPEFREAREKAGEHDGNVRRILIFFGGTDRTNETAKTLRAAEMLKMSGIHVDVVVGGANPHKDEVKRLSEALPSADFYSETGEMAALMAKAHLSIGACGTTTWERCCVGLPSVVMALAGNQTEIARGLGEKGIAANLGWHGDITVNDIKERLCGLLKSPRRLKTMSERSKELVDGEGARRVVDEILMERVFAAAKAGSTAGGADKGLEVRNALYADAAELFRWRNHPEVRRDFFNARAVGWEEHEKWFKEKISDPGSSVYMAGFWGERIGTVRFEPKDGAIKVSVMLSPLFIGKGLGAEVIRLCTERFIEEKRPDRPIVAEIKKENIRSIKAFERAGYSKSFLTYVYAPRVRRSE